MQWFRTIRPFSRMFVGLFLLAQLAGVVSSPTAAAATHAAIAHHHHHQHLGGHPTANQPVHHDHGDTDRCCALHAFFNGVLPSEMPVVIAALTGERLVPVLSERAAGITVAGLDRPPKPLR